ncbi:protein FAM200C-like [Styela clava]
MSQDVKDLVVNGIKASPMFSFQVNESTDVSSCAQLLVFARYIYSGDIKEEFLFCHELASTTTSSDIMEKLKIFFESANLEWKRVCGVCTDGAPAMLGPRSGFQKKVKELAPEAKGTHCVIHRYALASKTLPTPPRNVLDSVVKIVNYIKSGTLNSRQFKEMDSSIQLCGGCPEETF